MSEDLIAFIASHADPAFKAKIDALAQKERPVTDDKSDQFKEAMASLDEPGLSRDDNEQRDYLAAMAMQGLCGAVPSRPEQIAKWAYDIAEAMVAEGKKRNGK